MTVSEQIKEPTLINNTAISHGWAAISNLSAIAKDYMRLNPGPFLKWALPIFQDLHMLQDAIIPVLTEALKRLEATTTQIISYAETIDTLRREKDDKQTRINELETLYEFRKQQYLTLQQEKEEVSTKADKELCFVRNMNRDLKSRIDELLREVKELREYREFHQHQPRPVTAPAPAPTSAPEPTPPCAACKFPDVYKVVSLEEFDAYQRLLKTMEQIGLFLRANYTTEIASGLHTGRTDADIVTMYLYRERAYHKELEAAAKSRLKKSTAKSGTRNRTRSRGGNR